MAGGYATQLVETGAFFARSTRAPAVESWTMTADQVDAWLKAASVGDVLRYAHGPSLIQGAAAKRVRDAIDLGEVIPLPQKRCDDGGFDYRVVRNRVRVVRNVPSALDAGMRAVLQLLTEAAELGRVAPSDSAMGAALGGTPDQVKWALRKLVAGKWIETRIQASPRNPKFRVVKICATGVQTAGPGDDR